MGGLDTETFTLPSPLGGLAAALVIGLLFGLERGWSARDAAEGSRIAGLRTFSLIGLTGGALASLGAAAAPSLAAGLLGLAVMMAVAWREAVRRGAGLSATTAVAALCTYGLAALAATGHVLPALAAAIVAVVLLDYKSALHGVLRLIQHQELRAGLQMGVLSVVVLPLLPDTGLGPWGVLNPYRLWWAVVLLAGLSLAGHVAMRWSGPTRGVLLTGLLGGLATSTVATLTLARRARAEPALLEPAAAGALAAAAVMFLRVAVVVAALQPAMGRAVAPVMMACSLTVAGFAAWHWRHRGPDGARVDGEPVAPFDLGTMLGFGLLLAAVLVGVEAAKRWFGDAGVYAVTALSGLVDVDPVVVSMTRLWSAGGTAPVVPLVGVMLATLGGMVSKLVFAWTAGGGPFGRRIAVAYAASVAVGTVVAVAAW